MIAVVDDDVSFAEEIQDLLTMHGHRLVVVITHPHASSLDLLDEATLIILDLSLTHTTALNVLEEVRRRGNNPAVVMVSGSGTEALEVARAVAVNRGFPVLGALPKPVVATDLLGLLTPPGLPSGSGRSRHPETGTAMSAAAAPGCSPIFDARTLDYAGSHVRANGASLQPAPQLPPNPLSFLIDGYLDDPHRLVQTAVTAQRLLSLSGRHGLLVVQLPDAALLDPGIRADICSGAGYPPLARQRIVFELGSEASTVPLPHSAAMVELRLAGYGLLLRAVGNELPSPAALIELPITLFAIDAGALWPPRNFAGASDALRPTVELLRRRSVNSLCTDLRSASDLLRVRDLGIGLVSMSSEISIEQ
ncbi:MAG: hypothetical protein P4M09_08375 [Devosia sp.]|nr:hypothetical protein [Devosia sp.]